MLFMLLNFQSSGAIFRNNQRGDGEIVSKEIDVKMADNNVVKPLWHSCCSDWLATCMVVLQMQKKHTKQVHFESMWRKTSKG